MKFRFPIVIIDEDFRSENSSGLGIRAMAEAIEKEGFEVLGVTSYGDLSKFAQQQSRASAFVLSIDDEEFSPGPDLDPAVVNLRNFIEEVRWKNEDVPIYVYGETKTSRHLPNDILRELHGFIHMFEDTPEFVARHIIREAKTYLEGIQPPFFKALLDYAEDGSYSWHCPGHSGGVAFLKSPIGQMYHQFYGENMLRADVCNSVEELGQLLDHNGAIGASERNAARIFNADHCFFVTNGTSTSNKMVWHHTVAPGDVVVVDRNCHKSILHSIIMTGAIPLYLCPERNELGIIGPIPLSEFSKASIQAKIDASPLARGRAPKVKLAVVTNSTYDGLCYNAEMVKQALGDSVEVLHFDEAWYAYAAFHEFYAGRYGMGTQYDERSPLVFTTHSTHKLLAAFSQASMIHVQDGGQRQLDRDRFNEAFMMHISTSPQYGIIASLDVASAMMEGPAGRSLIQETFDEALSFRRALANVRRNLSAEDWWFSIWQPGETDGADSLKTSDWVLQPDADWHGFGEVADDYVLLDPIKVTLVMPGLNAAGKLEQQGIPAAVVSKFLWERGLVVEKTGLYSFLVLFSMGITKGKWSTLLTELLEFKRSYDANLPLIDVLPSIAHAGAGCYQGMGLRDLCDALHGCYRENATAKALKSMYTALPELAIKPADAYDRLVRGEVEAVPIDQLQGRIAAVMLVPYPPGIPLIMPGERFTAATRSILDYLAFARTFDQAFPGFDIDVHGLQTDAGGYCVDCLVE